MNSLTTTQKLILAFVTLILGAVLIAVVSSQGLTSTQKTMVGNETLDISDARNLTAAGVGDINETGANADFTLINAPTGWKLNDDNNCPLTSLVYKNDSLTFTLDTDYSIDLDTGVISILNTSTTRDSDNDTLVDYAYCQDTYMNLSWGRTAIDLVGGFFALALLMISLGLFYSIAREEGIF